MSTQPKTYLTPEQYLEIERKAETRSEYYQGEMFAMAGASWAHIMICTRLIITFGIRLDGSGCRVGNSDTRVNVSPTGLYTYPDLAIVCGQPRFLDGELDTLLNSLMVIEVLSPSTEKYDRTKKFDHYRTIESLREYLLVASEQVAVDLYSRQPDGSWVFTSARSLSESIWIPSLKLSGPLSEIYQDVNFETPQPLRS